MIKPRIDTRVLNAAPNDLVSLEQMIVFLKRVFFKKTCFNRGYNVRG
jgi:hypothetical protein